MKVGRVANLGTLLVLCIIASSLSQWELLWVPTSAYVGFGQLKIITCFQYLAFIGSSLLQHLASTWKQVPVSSCKSNPFDHSQPHSACTHVHLFALLLITGRAALNLNNTPQLSIKSAASSLIQSQCAVVLLSAPLVQLASSTHLHR
jgi:hypothetical protein